MSSDRIMGFSTETKYHRRIPAHKGSLDVLVQLSVLKNQTRGDESRIKLLLQTELMQGEQISHSVGVRGSKIYIGSLGNLTSYYTTEWHYLP